jgi:hypothetical protein
VGPVFTTQPISRGTRAGWNPLKALNCPYPATIRITAAVADPDGVAVMQLWVLKPAATSFVRLSHDFTTDGSLWYGYISTGIDGITDEGALSYYAVAIDSKGAQTRSMTRTLEVIRCDTEASISGGINASVRTNGHYYLQSCTVFSIPWRYVVSDRDGLFGVTVKYTITHTGAKTLSQTINLRHLLRSLIWAGNSIAPPNSNLYHGPNNVSWTVTSKDQYDETTISSGRAIVDFDQCVD